MTTLERLLIGLVIWAGSLGAAVWWGMDVGENKVLADAAREERIGRVATAAAVSAAASAIAAQRPKNVTIRQETEREIQTNVQYRDCVHSPEQLQRINAAITGDATERPGGGVVPKDRAPE